MPALSLSAHRTAEKFHPTPHSASGEGDRHVEQGICHPRKGGAGGRGGMRRRTLAPRHIRGKIHYELQVRGRIGAKFTAVLQRFLNQQRAAQKAADMGNTHIQSQSMHPGHEANLNPFPTAKFALHCYIGSVEDPNHYTYVLQDFDSSVLRGSTE